MNCSQLMFKKQGGDYQQLPTLSNMSVPRLVMVKGEVTNIQIHGFLDASERAIGACLYWHSCSGRTNYFCTSCVQNREYLQWKRNLFPGLNYAVLSCSLSWSRRLYLLYVYALVVFICGPNQCLYHVVTGHTLKTENLHYNPHLMFSLGKGFL